MNSTWNVKYTWHCIQRVDPPKRPAAKRITDFRQTTALYDEETASQQASRCIQCPEPGCVSACPLAIPIPALLGLTAEGQFSEAAELLLQTHSLPEVFTQVCAGQHLCEAACVLGGKTDPVPIGSIARFLLDHASRHGIREPAPAAPNGFRVAVIGSGLCGLVAADTLSRRGYSITVFDSHQEPGGRVMNGLPGFRVDKRLVQARVEQLRHRGVRFCMGAFYGQELKLEKLRADFHAVFLGLGRAEGIPLSIPGAHCQDVYEAYPFVLSNTTDLLLKVPIASVQGRRVVVLGGGETAMDALRVAIRTGASDALGIYRRDAVNLAANPASYQEALEEGAHFLFLHQPVEIAANAAGKVTAVRCVRTELGQPDSSGRQRAITSSDPPVDVPADVVLVAYGFAAPRLPDEGDFGMLAKDSQGRLIVTPEGMTNLPGVFAGGSIVRGPAPLADVVRDAQVVVEAIHQHLASLASVERIAPEQLQVP